MSRISFVTKELKGQLFPHYIINRAFVAQLETVRGATILICVLYQRTDL